MSSRFLTLLGAALLSTLVVAAAGAHDTWLLPDTLRVPVGRHVRVSLTSGMAFPADDFAIKPARIARADVRLGGTTRTLGAPTSGPIALVYDWRPRTTGVATLSIALAPRALTLRGALIAEYLDEIGADAALRAQWTPPTAATPWREVYTKHAKSFVLVTDREGDAGHATPRRARDTSWATPSGLGLELVPLADPTRLVAGDTLPLRVLYMGRPLAGFAVGAELERTAPAGTGPRASEAVEFQRTDSSGQVRLPLPSAGRWLLKGTQLRRVHEGSVDWRSEFTTLTLAVRSPS